MDFIRRLMVAALAVACVITIILLVALKSKAVDFQKDWLLEELSCEELVTAYNFQVNTLNDHIQAWLNCHEIAATEQDASRTLLHCALIKKNGQYVQGLANDLAAVFNAKPECTGAGE